MNMTVFKIANSVVTETLINAYRKHAADEAYIEDLAEKAVSDKDARRELFNTYFYGACPELARETIFKSGEGDKVLNNLILKAESDVKADAMIDAVFFYAAIVFTMKAKNTINSQLGNSAELADVANETYISYLMNKRDAVKKDNPKRYLITIMKNSRVRMLEQEGTLVGVLSKAGSTNREDFRTAISAGQSEDKETSSKIFDSIKTRNTSTKFSLLQVYNQGRAYVNFDAEVKTKDADSIPISEIIADQKDPGYKEVENQLQQQSIIELLPCPIMRLIINSAYMEGSDKQIGKKKERDRAQQELEEMYGIDRELFEEMLCYAEDIIAFKLDPLCEKPLNPRRRKKYVGPDKYEERKRAFCV